MRTRLPLAVLIVARRRKEVRWEISWRIVDNIGHRCRRLAVAVGADGWGEEGVVGGVVLVQMCPIMCLLSELLTP